MDLQLVMDELAARLNTISGLQVFGYPASPINPPTAMLSYPEAIAFDQTYGRGVDHIKALPLAIIDGDPTSIDTRNRLAAYTAGAGDRSVKAVLESGVYAAFDEVQVVSAEFDVVTIADIDYMAALLELDITGRGTP